MSFGISQAAVLGAVQGMTEFLPVSSSAHLVLIPWLFKWTVDPGLAFDVALHLGTLGAILWVFRKDWARLFLRERRTLLLVAVATVPGAVVGKWLEPIAEQAFRSPLVVAAAMVAAGILLWLAERRGPGTRTVEHLTWRDALLVGGAQAAAIVPGVSRAGITMTAALFSGLTRESSARFSFLLAAPILGGAGLLKLGAILQNEGHVQLIIGVITSACVGALSITFLLRFLRSHTFLPFVYYRWGVGALIAAVWWARR